MGRRAIPVVMSPGQVDSRRGRAVEHRVHVAVVERVERGVPAEDAPVLCVVAVVQVRLSGVLQDRADAVLDVLIVAALVAIGVIGR